MLEIIKDISDINSSLRGNNDSEIELGSRENTDAYLCGDVFNDENKVKLYVEELIPRNIKLVARYCRDQKNYSFNFEELLQYASDEGEAYHMQKQKVRRGPKLVLKTVNKNGRTVTFKEPSSRRGTIMY